jgi:DME family drug/metabolite transporter
VPAHRPGPALVVLAAVCWGTGGLAGSVLGSASDLSPLAVGSYRLLVAAAVLLAVRAAVRGEALAATVRGLLARGADGVRVLGVGVGLAVFQLCYFVAVRALGVSIATLLTLGLAPVLVTVAARVLLGERGGPSLRLAMPVALLGLLLLVGLVGGDGGAGAPPGAAAGDGAVLGVAAAVTSAVGYAAVTLLARSLSARVEPTDVSTLGFAVAALVALPAGAVAGLAFPPHPVSLALVVYLGVVPTALAYGLFFAGLRRTASGTASVLTLVEPLTATLLAVLLLGERLSVVQWAGAALLVTAVAVLAVPGRRAAPTLVG